MPYTPPAQHSPSGSRPESPSVSRRTSLTQTPQPQPQSTRSNASNDTRPQLPRSNSASYLHRHRRSPSLKESQGNIQDSFLTATPESTPTAMTFGAGLGSSVRQSPPPVNDNAVPPGAVISPPDSAQNSSDDDDEGKRGRRRDLSDLAHLQEVVKGLEQKRQGSPSTKAETGKIKLQLGLPIARNTDTPSSVSSSSPDGRHISHARSNTDSAIIDHDRSAETPDRSADSDEDDGRYKKPSMLRKKSGELVRPALRPASAKRRPTSMPGTPTYGKNVHFDSHLEHVRTFLQVDRPLAVSANSSPVETYDGDSEFPFYSEGSREPSWKWEIKLPNFPTHSVGRQEKPIHVEKVHLSSDGKTLIGVVAVQNLAFHKLVVARFTLDFWKTTSEVTAEYSRDVRRPVHDNLDRFHFNLKLEDLANLENKSLFFCVRYNVNGQEFWDSNNNVNFQVDFAKKSTQKGKQGATSTTSKALPRSRPATSAGERARPKSTSAFDDFSHGFGTDHPLLPFQLNDTPIKFRKQPGGPSPISPTLNPRVPTQAFGNRYDFAASLSAAISRAGLSERTNRSPGNSPDLDTPKPTPVSTGSATPSKPAALATSKPDPSSQSYNELINKYCFFGSSSARKPQAPPESSNSDQGPNEADVEYFSSRTSSAQSSPPAAPSPPSETPPLTPPEIAPSPLLSARSTGLDRATSPISFGYPYHATRQGGIFSGGAPLPAVFS